LRNIFLNKFYLKIQSLLLIFYEVISANIFFVFNKIPHYIQYIYISQNKVDVAKKLIYLNDFDYFLKFFFYTFDQTIFEEIAEKDISVSTEEITSKTLDQLLFNTTN